MPHVAIKVHTLYHFLISSHPEFHMYSGCKLGAPGAHGVRTVGPRSTWGVNCGPPEHMGYELGAPGAHGVWTVGPRSTWGTNWRLPEHMGCGLGAPGLHGVGTLPSLEHTGCILGPQDAHGLLHLQASQSK